MHGAHIHDEAEHDVQEEAPDLGVLRTHLAYVLSGLLVLLLLAFIPPLLNVSRFQRRIASNLSSSLGRPVHLDRVSLSLLPLPGFTLENFVVSENPAFGYEPILRANEVRATVRISSLWTHHVEFSRISLTEPTSLNLVRLSDGRWNFEPVLLQASRIETAPTGQPYSGRAPRFPYIEASGARINLKLDQEKTPFSLTDSEFALWLPTTRQWRFRLEAHPARTDVAPSDAGIVRFEGALGDGSTRAATLGQVPIDLHAVWDAAPLAGLGRIVFARDIGLRGDITLNLHALGTVDEARLSADLKLAHARRADFVPPHLIALETACSATAKSHFQSFTAVECRWPPTASGSQPGLLASGSVPQVSNAQSASFTVRLLQLPVSALLDWVQAATPHPPTTLAGSGTVTGSVMWNPQFAPTWTGDMTIAGESLQLPPSAHLSPTPLPEINFTSASPNHARKHPALLARGDTGPSGRASFDLGPLPLPLGGHQPATLDGHVDASGYTLHLVGSVLPARLLALGQSFPQFGEGLGDLLQNHPPSEPGDESDPALRVDLTANRRWGQPQTWTDNSGTTLAAKR